MGQISDFPEAPEILTHFAHLVRQDDLDLRQIETLFQGQMELEKKVLRIVNSRIYGFTHTLSHLSQAAVYVSVQEIYYWTVLCVMMDTFAGSHNTDYLKKDYWMHAVGCGVATKEIARHMAYSHLGEAFLAGVLHDIGKLIWDKYLPQDLTKILQRVRSENILFVDSEQHMMHVTHADLGLWFVRHWELPSFLEGAIARHHHPQESSGQDLVIFMVHIADILVRAMDIGNGGDEKIPVMNKSAWVLCGMNWAVLPSLCHRIDESFLQSEILVNMAMH
jgi:HD-like signal output (HDOD) protein